MTSFESLLARQIVASPLPFDLNAGRVLRLDLSEHNAALGAFDPGDTALFSAFIHEQMVQANALCAAGGYGENRTLYQMSPVFRSADAEPRTLHLGIDLWLAAVKTGVVLVPVNVLYRERELKHILADAAPVAVVTSPDLAAFVPAGVVCWDVVELAAESATQAHVRETRRSAGGQMTVVNHPPVRRVR